MTRVSRITLIILGIALSMIDASHAADLKSGSTTVTPTVIANQIKTQSGCSTAGYVWVPASNTCVAQSSGGGATLPSPGIVYGTSSTGGTVATAAQINTALGNATTSTIGDLLSYAGVAGQNGDSGIAAGSILTTAASVASKITSQTGCSTAGYVWVPSSNTCVAQASAATGVAGNVLNFATGGQAQDSGTALSSLLTNSMTIAGSQLVGQASRLWGTILATFANITNLGDSLTLGTGASTNALGWANLLDVDTGAGSINYGIGGEMACDMDMNEVFGTNNSQISQSSSSAFTLMIGTNEANSKGAGAYEAVYHTCHQAALAWLGIDFSRKTTAAACNQTSGTWTADTVPKSGIGEQSTTNGSVLTCSITTTGAPIYIWYPLSDASAGTFTYAIDGGAASATINSFTTPAIATINGGTTGMGFIRVPSIAAGTHSVAFTVTSATGTSNIVDIWSIGSPATQPLPAYSVIFSAGVIKQYADGASASTAAYDADAHADNWLLYGDGLPIRDINVRGGLLTTGAPDMVSGNLHPTNTGHQHLKEIFEAAMQFPRPIALPTVASGGVNYITSNAQNLSQANGTLANPGFIVYGSAAPYLYGMDFGNDTSGGGLGTHFFGYNGMWWSQSNLSTTAWMTLRSGRLCIGDCSASYSLDIPLGQARSAEWLTVPSTFNAAIANGNINIYGGLGGTFQSTTLGTNVAPTISNIVAGAKLDLQICQPNSRFTGSISGTTLTVTTAGAIPLAVNEYLVNNTSATAITAGTQITALGTGTGGTGTYTINNSQTVSSEQIDGIWTFTPPAAIHGVNSVPTVANTCLSQTFKSANGTSLDPENGTGFAP
jgi:hypothetical protein